MSLDRKLLASVLEKTAFAPPMADPMAAGGAPPMDPAMMGGAPPMDPAMADQLMAAGAAPMDPAMAEMPPTGPAPEQVGAVAEEDIEPPQPTVADMSIEDLQLLIADTVKAVMSESGAPIEGQVSELQDIIAGMNEQDGAIPTDSPTMPAPDASMLSGFSEEAVAPQAASLPEGSLPKQASEDAYNGELLAALKRLNTLR